MWLDLQLLSPLRCLKWQQARNPADLKLLRELSAPAITDPRDQANMFCPGSTDPAPTATLPQQPPCPNSHPAQTPTRDSCRRGRISCTLKHPMEKWMRPWARII